MKFLYRMMRRRKPANLTTALERQRLSRTMPGQTAALAANRMGGMIG